MKLYVGHVRRDNAYIMPCMFLVCASDIHSIFNGLCEQYLSYFKGIPGDCDIMNLSVEFNIEMLPNSISLIDDPVKFDFIEIFTAIADDVKENCDEQ